MEWHFFLSGCDNLARQVFAVCVGWCWQEVLAGNKLSRDLREVYEDITPGYHMNKKHWNTINIQGTLDEEEILKLIDMSYNLVVNTLPKKERESFKSAE